MSQGAAGGGSNADTGEADSQLLRAVVEPQQFLPLLPQASAAIAAIPPSVEFSDASASSHGTDGSGYVRGFNAAHPASHPITAVFGASSQPSGGGDSCNSSSGQIIKMQVVSSQQQQQQQFQQHHSFISTPGSFTIPPGSVPCSPCLQGKEDILRRLSAALVRGSLTQIDLSQRSLQPSDARLIRLALMHNPSLSVLKLGYNNLGDHGTCNIAEAIRGHPSLSILDIGFNNVGDMGCASLASNAVTRNPNLRTLYLSGNSIGEKGTLDLAQAVRLEGCGLQCLHLSANRIGANGVKALMRAIAEREEREHAAAQNGTEELTDVDDRRMNVVDENSESRNSGLQKLYMGGTAMGSAGCLSVSNMLLTNFSLRVLSLSDNGIEDRDLALFSQSISRNKLVPLEVLRLSFNRLTCAGVESLMNAVWGSTTLRELRLDNNRVHDRGAQLVAVVLTSVNLEVVDLGFNIITATGIKALMKSLAENDSLQSLTLSGNPLDINASKGVSYALAYNTSLRKLYVDHCSVGYAAQRHITAGIASNSSSALRVVTGFRIGAIAVTLGLPLAMENWTNEQVLNFFHLMWERWRCEKRQYETIQFNRAHGINGSSFDLPRRSMGSSDDSAIRESKSADDILANGDGNKTKARVGPSDPTTVVSAAKSAFESLGDASGRVLRRKPSPPDTMPESPLAPTEAILLERTLSGTIRVPPIENIPVQNFSRRTPSPNTSMHITCNGAAHGRPPFPTEHLQPTESQIHGLIRTKRNMEWLNQNLQALNEVAKQPFDNADLWKLHQHFFSPVDATPRQSSSCGKCDSNEFLKTNGTPLPPTTNQPNDPLHQSKLPYVDKRRWSASPPLERKISYRFLSDAMAVASSCEAKKKGSMRQSISSPGGRRRTVSVLNENCLGGQAMQPASKRAKKARIAFYPRIKEKLEILRSKASQHQALILMRQLKYVESVLFKGKNIYSDVAGSSDPDQFLASDAEAILVDML